jgi:hypothetical protein
MVVEQEPYPVPAVSFCRRSGGGLLGISRAARDESRLDG